MARQPGAFTKARPAKDIRQRAWQAMRLLKNFTAYDVQATAEIGKDNLKKYIQALHRAGFLVLAKPKESGKSLGHAVWRLAKDTGPKHPIIRKYGLGVFDQNTGKAWLDGKEVPNEPADEPKQPVSRAGSLSRLEGGAK